MKLDPARIKNLCRRRGLSLQAALRGAGVSRTAYYALLRKGSVLPRSIEALAESLEVAPSAILVEIPAVELRARALLRRARRVLSQAPGASFDNVWHTLVLLEEPPIERLRRSLLRGRAADLHR